MSSTQVPRTSRIPRQPGATVPGCTPRRRVRHDARDAVAVMAFSAGSSTLLAVLLTLVVRAGG